MASISRIEETKTSRKRDQPLMYCGRCGSPLKQFGALSRRRHAARCDYDRARNVANLRDPERRARMLMALGESGLDVMGAILGVSPRIRAVWFEDGSHPTPQLSSANLDS